MQKTVQLNTFTKITDFLNWLLPNTEISKYIAQ